MLMLNSAIVPTVDVSAHVSFYINMFLSDSNVIIQFTSPFNELPYYSAVDPNTLRSDDLVSSSQTIDVTAIIALRPDLTLRASTDAKQQNTLTAILNQNANNRIGALFSISKTVFVCLVLLLMLHLFSNDIDSLIVEPIEGMMDKLMKMAKDPESAATQELNTNTELETTVISNAIIKIGALLSIVFGSAGAEIIGSNIIEEGDMNPMI